MNYKQELENLINKQSGKANHFTIYLGTLVNDNIFNKIIKNYNKIFEKYKVDNPKFKNIKYKQYNHDDLILTISNKLSCSRNVLVDTNNIKLFDLDLHCTFWDITNIDSSLFSCQLDYHNERQSEKTVFNFNNHIEVIFDNNSICLRHKIQPNSLKLATSTVRQT